MNNANPFYKAFELIGQTVVIAVGERIEYMNSSAEQVFGKNRVGEMLSGIFPTYLLNVQASSFASTMLVGTQSFGVSVMAIPEDNTRVFVMTPRASFDTDNALVLSHLRNELMNIRMATAQLFALGQSSSDPTLLESSGMLNRSYHSIKRLVDNLSVIRLLGLGELPFAPRNFDLTEACRDILDSLGYMMGERSPTLRFSAAEHYRIVGDRMLIELLLMNLLVNSIEHCTPDNTVSVSLLRTNKSIILGVSDNGSGIEQGGLAGIFDSFRRSTELPGAEQGCGMGLSIVQGIAELHGGAVIIESRGKGLGTSVRVTLSDNANARVRFSDGYLRTDDLKNRLLTQCSSILPDGCFSEEPDK